MIIILIAKLYCSRDDQNTWLKIW